MAQIIKNRRGSLDRLSAATGSLQKGEILIATGSSKLTGVTNGQGLVFAAVESGSVVAANRVLQGANAPIFSASSYGHLMDGVPFYASSSNTLFLLGADGNTTPDLTGNISTFSSSVATSFSASAASIASVTGDFSSSVATSFSASNASVTALSASTYHAVFGFGELSSSIEQSISASNHITSDLSASVATSFSASAASQTLLSASIATTDSASAYQISQLSASVASVGGTFSSSVATDFSASNAARVALSASVNTRFGVIESTYATTGSNTFNGDQIVSGAFQVISSASAFKIEGNIFGQTYLTGNGAIVLNPGYGGVEMVGSNRSFKATDITAEGTLSASVITGIGNVTDYSSSVNSRFSASAYNVAELSASVASVGGTFSSSVATDFSASTAARVALSASIATTDSASAAYAASQLNSVSSSVATSFSASAASVISLSSSIATTDNAQSDRLDIIESTYATTGSNTFSGSQVVSGSLWVTGDVTIYGSSSLVNVTASAVTLGTNTIVLNTANPAVRFGGIQVIDSGSSQSTGSLYWDSTNNVWLYANPIGAGYGSARLIAGPQNTGSLGEEIGLTSGTIPVAVGDDHIADSNLKLDSGTLQITEGGGLQVDGEISSSTINGIGNVTDFSSSIATDFSSSKYQISELSASVASVGGTFSSSVASDFSASNAARVALSASVATSLSASVASQTNLSASIATTDSASAAYAASQLSSVSGALATSISASNASQNALSGAVATTITNLSSSIATTNSASAYQISELSASVASVGGTFSSSVATDFSASNAARVALSASISSDVNTLSQSFDSRIAANDFLDSTYATTGSNVFHGDQTITGSVDMTGTLNVNNAVAVNDSNMNLGNSSSLNLTGGSSIYVGGSGTISGSIVGIGNVSLYSASVDSRFSASTYDISILSASVASVGGTFSSSVATDFSASNAARVALSASIAITDNSQSVRLSVIENTYATTGSNDFVGTQTITGDVIVSGSLSVQFGQDLITNHISGNQGRIELGNIDANIHIKADNELMLTATGSGVHVHSANFSVSPSGLNNNVLVVSASQTTITNELSASNISGVGNIGAFSQSVDSRFSASAYNVAELSASVASVGGTFSQSVATDFSASNAARVALSQSVYDTLFWPSTGLSASLSSGSQYQVNTLSQSVYDTLYWPTTGLSASFSSSLGQLSGSFSSSISTLSSSVSTSLHSELYGDGMFNFGFSGSVSSSISSLSSSVSESIYNNLFNSANPNAISTSFASASAFYSASATTFVSESIYQTIFFPSTGLSASIATTDSASAFQIAQLSASVASVGGTFSSSVATDFSASAAAREALSASIAITDNAQSDRIDSLESYTSSLQSAIELTGSSVTIQGDLLVRGTTTSVNSTTIELGDNIIELNGTGATNGGLYVKDVTNPNTATGSLLWDSTNDYWKAGTKNSESKVLLAVGDNVVSGGAQIAIADLDGYADFNDNLYTDINAASASAWGAFQSASSYSSSFATSISASNFEIASLSASVASVGGTFSSSVATDFSASNAARVALSASVATDFSASAAYQLNLSSSVATNFSASAANITSISGAFATSTSASNYQIAELSASVASVGGTFSSSVATSFSASYASVSALSASIYLTDATQSSDISNNSSSFATSISASNFRITLLETTIDGGSF